MSLRLKLTAFNILIVLIAGTILSYRALVGQEEIMLGEKRLRAEELLTNLSAFSQEAVILRDRLTLEVAANRFLENQDMVFLALKMGDDVLLATDLAQPERLGPLIQDGRERLSFDGDELVILRHPVEVKGKQFGTYVAGLSLAGVRAQIAHNRNRLILLATLITAVLMLLASLVNDRAIRPLERLGAFARGLAAGKLGQELQLGRTDELGQLAEALSWMSRELLQAQQELVQSERLAQELEIAKNMQQQFLPEGRLELERVAYEVYFQSAKQVGGDGYDVLRLADGRVGFVVTDVSGKGIEGALGMIVTTTLIRSAVSRGLSDPLEILDTANDELVRLLPGTMFATVGFVAIDPVHHRGEFVSAGHPEILAVGREGVRDMTGRETGVPLGMAESELWRTRTVKKAFELAPGEGVLVYTDGISETFNDAGELYGDERVSEFLAAYGAQDPAAMVERLVAELDRFRGGRQELDDDMTILMLKVA